MSIAQFTALTSDTPAAAQADVAVQANPQDMNSGNSLQNEFTRHARLNSNLFV